MSEDQGASFSLHSTERHHPEWRTAGLVFTVAALVYAVSPVITNYDSYAFFPTAVSIVNRHTLSLDAYRHVHVVATSYTVAHTNGRLLPVYPWPVALFALPAVVLLDLIHLVGGPSADAVVAHHPQVGSLVQLWSASIVTALACGVLALVAYRRLGGSAPSRRRWAAGSALVFAFTTSAWSTASRALWQHGPSILFLSLGLLALDHLFPQRQVETPTSAPLGRYAFSAGIAFAVALTLRPTNVIALALAGLVIAWRRWSMIPAFVLGVILVLLPWVAITYASYGRFLQPYDQSSRLGLVSTFFESIAANLVSPSRGLIIFSPIVLAAPAGFIVAYRRRSLGPLEVLCAAAVASYILVLGFWSVWWAGNSFGPRFTTEALPFLFVLALPFVDWLRVRRSQPNPVASRRDLAVTVVTGVVFMLSLVANAQGGLLRASSCWNGVPQNVDTNPSRVWSWSDPQVDYGLRALKSEGLRAIMRCPPA